MLCQSKGAFVSNPKSHPAQDIRHHMFTICLKGLQPRPQFLSESQ
jgi:hypothetical protein